MALTLLLQIGHQLVVVVVLEELMVTLVVLVVEQLLMVDLETVVLEPLIKVLGVEINQVQTELVAVVEVRELKVGILQVLLQGQEEAEFLHL
jgi:hypothetical protein